MTTDNRPLQRKLLHAALALELSKAALDEPVAALINDPSGFAEVVIRMTTNMSRRDLTFVLTHVLLLSRIVARHLPVGQLDQVLAAIDDLGKWEGLRNG